MSFEEIRMDDDEGFDKFYAKLKDIVNSTFNLGEKIPESKIVRKILRSLPERFHAKITTIEELKDIDSIPLTELIGNLQTYELGLVRIGKGSKSKNMALKERMLKKMSRLKMRTQSSNITLLENSRSSSRMQMSREMTRITKKSEFSQFKPQDKFKRESKEGGQNSNIPTGLKCYGCQRYRHMKQEFPTYLKSIGKSKALAAILSDTEPEADLEDSDQEGIVSAFTAIIDSSKEVEELVDEEEDLMEYKFEEMDEKDKIHTTYAKLYNNFEKHEKLYRLATRKLSEVELELEELSTEVDEANQTIGALRFENSFLAEKTKKLDAELFQVRA